MPYGADPTTQQQSAPPPISAQIVPAQSQAGFPGLDQSLLPIVQRESGGKPFVGYTPPGQPLVDLSKAPLDDTGFPIWSGSRDPQTGLLSHAAGIAQIQPGTWRPIAQKLGIHDFSLDSQIKVANELHKEQGETPWQASAGYGRDPVVSAGNWHVDPNAIRAAQDQKDGQLLWMGPDEYKQMVQRNDAPEERSESKSLSKSLAKGDAVTSIPELTVKFDNGKYVVVDQDGWHRADAAERAGVQLIPVFVRGATAPATEIVGMGGQSRPFDFKKVPAVPQPPSALTEFGRGLADVPIGAAQAATHAGAAQMDMEAAIGAAGTDLKLPEQMTQAPAQIDTAIQQREQSIEAERQAAGQTGIDWARLGGNVAATLPLAALAPTAGGGVLGAIGAGAAAGAGGAALAPVTQGDYGAEKAKQIAMGAGLGGALGAGGNMLARVAQPYIDPAAQRLMDMGVRLLPGQMKGPGAFRTLEQQSTSIPFSGSAVAAAQRRAIEDFNRAIYNKVLNFIGARIPVGSEVGTKGLAAVEKKLSDAYDALKPYIQFRVDGDFRKDLQDIASDLSAMPDMVRTSFNNVWQSRVVPLLKQGGGVLDGKTFKLLESQLSSDARDWTSFQNSPFEKRVGYAIKDLLGALRAGIERTSPTHARELKALNTAWAAFVRVQDAVARRPTSLGIFTPGDLLASEKKMAGKSVFARGDGLLQEAASDAEKIIGSRYPDSGTAGRAATMGQVADIAATLFGAATHPGLTAGLLMGQGIQGLAYGTAPGVNFLGKLAGAGMPALRNTLSRILRSGSVGLAPAAGVAGAMPQITPPGL